MSYIVSGALFGSLVMAVGCVPNAGAACWDEGALQCVDKTHAVLCSGHVWTPASCAGARGCAAMGQRAACDDSRVSVAIPCLREGQVSCSADAKSRVQCKDKVWTVIDTCVASACVATAEHVWCDTAVRVAP